MIVNHQNQLAGYAGAHRYYAPFIQHLPQYIGSAEPVTTVSVVVLDRTHPRYAIRDLTGPRYWVRRIQ